MKGNFIDNLPKVYGIYTGGFVGFIILMAIGEQMGMSSKAIGITSADETPPGHHNDMRTPVPGHTACIGRRRRD